MGSGLSIDLSRLRSSESVTTDHPTYDNGILALVANYYYSTRVSEDINGLVSTLLGSKLE
jgi:hypothetical protein